VVSHILPFWLDPKERKSQGGESLAGGLSKRNPDPSGLFSNAAPFEWSIKLSGSKQRLWPVTNAAKASLKTPFNYA
jgi:hypothetical protein